MSGFTGAAKRFTESKFDVSSAHTEDGFLCTVRNDCGNLICKVEARTFEQAVNAALDMADATSAKTLERRAPKFVVLPNGDAIRADLIGAIRLAEPLTSNKPRVLVDYGTAGLKCSDVGFDDYAARDEYAQLLLGQIEEILQGGAQ